HFYLRLRVRVPAPWPWTGPPGPRNWGQGMTGPLVSLVDIKQVNSVSQCLGGSFSYVREIRRSRLPAGRTRPAWGPSGWSALQVDRAVEHHARRADGHDQPVDRAHRAAGHLPRDRGRPPGVG